jgi:hypothetical protein
VLLGHFLVLRGKNRCMAELADLTVMQYLPKEGPTPCLAVVLQITASKVNQTSHA